MEEEGGWRGGGACFLCVRQGVKLRTGCKTCKNWRLIVKSFTNSWRKSQVVQNQGSKSFDQIPNKACIIMHARYWTKSENTHASFILASNAAYYIAHPWTPTVGSYWANHKSQMLNHNQNTGKTAKKENCALGDNAIIQQKWLMFDLLFMHEPWLTCPDWQIL